MYAFSLYLFNLVKGYTYSKGRAVKPSGAWDPGGDARHTAGGWGLGLGGGEAPSAENEYDERSLQREPCRGLTVKDGWAFPLWCLEVGESDI